jgi:hypothetical protein
MTAAAATSRLGGDAEAFGPAGLRGLDAASQVGLCLEVHLERDAAASKSESRLDAEVYPFLLSLATVYC